MDEIFKLQSLQEMMDEIKKDFPFMPDDAIKEYLSQINKEKADVLKEKLKDASYFENFKTAIAHTSFMITIALLIVTQKEHEIDYDKYIREYLFFARQDDKDIYDMRVFYLDSLNSSELDIENQTKESANKYDMLLKSLLKQYKLSKMHLL